MGIRFSMDEWSIAVDWLIDWIYVFEQCHEELTSDLSFDLISPQLIQRGIMSTDEYANIR